MISSLRRNLQREHMQRLVDLILEDANDTAAFNAISNLARMELRSLASKVAGTLERCGEKMDPIPKHTLLKQYSELSGHLRRDTPMAAQLLKHQS